MVNSKSGSVMALCLIVSLLFIASVISSCGSSEPKTPPAPTKNASVIIGLQELKVTPGGQLRYNMTVTNRGDEKNYDVAIEHRVFSTPLGRVVKTEGEIVKLETWVYKDKSITLPSDSQVGNYQLTVSITYGANATAKAEAFFDVVAPIEEVNKSNAKLNTTLNASLGQDSPKIASNKSTDLKSVSNKSSSSANTSDAQTVPVQAPAPTGKTVIVEHKNREFVPNEVRIEPGDTVRWIQRDKTSGQVEGSGFHSGPLGVDKEFKHTFKKPGIFSYYSQLTHAAGTIIVENPDLPVGDTNHDPYSFKGELDKGAIQ